MPVLNIPRYAANPLLGFLSYWRQSSQLLHVSMHGISIIRTMPRIVQILHDVDPPDTTADILEGKHETLLEKAKAEAALAEKECEDGFPLLHAHTLVGMWGAFEASIEDMLVGILMNEPDLLNSGSLAKIRVPYAEFEALEKEERIRRLIDELQRSQGFGRKQGTDGFEMLLEQVKLIGSIPPEIKKTIWQLHHVRNVIVHRASLADGRLVRSCPWMNLKVGDRVTVSHAALIEYGNALAEYTHTIATRLAEHYEVDMKARLDQQEKREIQQ
jgi:hypothetical protein